MALSIVSQSTRTGGLFETEHLYTTTAGNWLVAMVTFKVVEGTSPLLCVADYARNLWQLVYSATARAAAANTGAHLFTQVWVCPAAQFQGWTQAGIYTSIFPAYTSDGISSSVSIIEVAGMGNGFLTVDSVTVATASAATTLSVAVPTPSGSADCLMIAVAGTDSGSGTVTITSTPAWSTLTAVSNTVPNALLVPMWRESTTGLTASWSSTVATNWAAVAVAIRVTGIGPAQPNPNMPAQEFQLALGWHVTTPVSAVTWTTLPNRLLSYSTQRGIQYELGTVQSSPTDLLLRNDDGALSPRPAGTGTATAAGTTTTLLVASADGATMTVTDFFQLKTSGGVLKETTVFQIVSLVTSGGTTTVTFTRADQAGGGALAATATGDLYSACPIDLYLPYRILATFGGVRYPVTTGWIERWPQTWRDPHWGDVPAVAIDTIATLTAADVEMLRGEIMARNPHSYWPCDDAAGASQAENQGVGTTPLVQTQSSHGAGVNGAAQFGVTTQNATNGGWGGNTGQYAKSSIIGGTGSAWQSDGQTPAEEATMGFALVANAGNDTTFPSITNGVTIMGVSFQNYQWSAIDLPNMTTDPTMLIVRSAVGTGAAATQIKISVGHSITGTVDWQDPKITVWDKTTHASTTTTTTSELWGGAAFQMWALTFNQTSWKFYYGPVAGAVVLNGSGSCNLAARFGLIGVGGEADSTTNGNFARGIWAHIAVFGKQLTVNELTDINNAVNSATYTYSGTNDSISRHLAYAGWNGSRLGTFTNYTNGPDVNPPSTVGEKIIGIADYEGGKVFADATGCLQFRGQERAAAQISRVTLGDRPDLGEIPVVGDSSGLQLDYDPTFIYNQISISDLSYKLSYLPADATTTYMATDTTSISRYGLKTLAKTVSFNDGGTHAFGMANYYLNAYAYPKLRLAQVVIGAATAKETAAATWAFVLGVEVGDRVTLNKRPIGAPPITLTCVVLSVQHDVGPDQWDTTLTLGLLPS